MSTTNQTRTAKPLTELRRTTREDLRLHRVLERERSRVDRQGGQITLVVFHFDRPVRWPSRKMKRLMLALDSRSRITDEIGRLDQSRAFALLPGTEPWGGRRLAEDVVTKMAGWGVKVDYALFRYASARPKRSVDRDEDDHDDQGGERRGGQRLLDRLPAKMADREPVGAGTADAAHCLVAHFSHRLPWWKRGMDIAFSLVGLMLLSPVLLTVAMLIKLDSRGPVFFKQERMGVGRSRFVMWKFRTMVVNAAALRDSLMELNEQDGPAFKITSDPRVTRVGRLLRCTSIDELPQLINVLRGEMTLVGPRPLPVFEAQACESWQDRRHTVHPGLTCIWQVNGRSRVSFDEWSRMDVCYTRRISLWRDLKILLMTIPAVIKQDGAH